MLAGMRATNKSIAMKKYLTTDTIGSGFARL